jgi:hypothetical protein
MKKNKKPCGPIFSAEQKQKQKIALLKGFQKQNTHTTLPEYAKANNVSRPTLSRWAVLYGVPLGRHYTLDRHYTKEVKRLRIQREFKKNR